MVTSRERALAAVGRFCWSELCASDWMDAFWWVTDNPVQSFNICGEKNMLLSSVGAFYRFYCGNVRMDGHGRFLFALRFFCLRFFFYSSRHQHSDICIRLFVVGHGRISYRVRFFHVVSMHFYTSFDYIFLLLHRIEVCFLESTNSFNHVSHISLNSHS